MVLKKVYVVRKEQPKCRRNTISTLRETYGMIPKLYSTITYKRQKLQITRIFSHPKAGALIEWESSNGDIGVCVAHYWWDKIKEEADKHKAA